MRNSRVPLQLLLLMLLSLGSAINTNENAPTATPPANNACAPRIATQPSISSSRSDGTTPPVASGPASIDCIGEPDDAAALAAAKWNWTAVARHTNGTRKTTNDAAGDGSANSNSNNNWTVVPVVAARDAVGTKLSSLSTHWTMEASAKVLNAFDRNETAAMDEAGATVTE